MGRRPLHISRPRSFTYKSTCTYFHNDKHHHSMENQTEASARPCANEQQPTNSPQDEVIRLKRLVHSKNDELYQLQVAVLQITWQGQNDRQRSEELAQQCQDKEREINNIVAKLKAIRAISEGHTQEYIGQQAKLAQQLEQKAGTASGSFKKVLCSKATILERQANSMVRELRASLSRTDHKQFKDWQVSQQAELWNLQRELDEARRSGGDVSAIEERIEAVHAELERMLDEARSHNDTNYNDDSDTDSELSYEELEELEAGDRVRLVCEDEDGFKRGDEAIVLEVSSSDTYPYHIRSVRSHSTHGYFKACDLRLVRSKGQALGRIVMPTSMPQQLPTPPASPYTEIAELSADNIDLEKGLCRQEKKSPTSVSNSIRQSLFDASETILTLNPLAVCRSNPLITIGWGLL